MRRCVTAVVVTFNSAETIQRCLTSLSVNSAGWVDRIVVVDNASSDTTCDVVRQTFPEVKLFANQDNEGFGAGCNRGAAEAKSEFVLFLNPDAALDVGALGELVGFLDARDAAACCGPFIRDEEGTPDPAARRGFPTPWNAVGRLFFMERLFPASRFISGYTLPWLGFEREVKVDCIVGACMLVRSGAFRQVGEFDLDYFLFGEDIDLCKRLKDAGHETWYVPSAGLLHTGGHSMRSATRMARHEFYRAMRIYMDKHWRNLPALPFYAARFGIHIRELIDRMVLPFRSN